MKQESKAGTDFKAFVHKQGDSSLRLQHAYSDALSCSWPMPCLQKCASFFLHPTLELTSKQLPQAAATTSFTRVLIPPALPSFPLPAAILVLPAAIIAHHHHR